MANMFEWGDFSEKSLRSIATSNRRINIWHGAVRSGKTVSSQIRWLKFIKEAPRKGHLLMVGVTIGTLKDNILDPISEMVGPENYHYSAGAREVWICGRRCLIRGAGDEAAEKKIRGLTLAGVYGDELTLWPKNFFKRSLDRLSVEGAKFFGTTNPDSPYHWLRTDYLDREHELNLVSYHFELEDNPNLPRQYVEDLKKEFTGLWYKRFILGLWVVAEGAIYDMFDEKEHVVKSWEHVWGRPERPPFEQVIGGIDHGASNPTALVLAGLYKGTWYAFAEHRHEGQQQGGISRTNTEHREAHTAFLRNGGYLPGRAPAGTKPLSPRFLLLDPSAAAYRAELKRHGTHGTREVENAENDVLQGIQIVSTGLTNGKLKIHESCRALIKEMMTYIWDPKAIEDHGRDKPIKQHDHSLDALRYLAMRALKHRPRNLKKPRGV